MMAVFHPGPQICIRNLWLPNKLLQNLVIVKADIYYFTVSVGPEARFAGFFCLILRLERPQLGDSWDCRCLIVQLK